MRRFHRGQAEKIVHSQTLRKMRGGVRRGKRVRLRVRLRVPMGLRRQETTPFALGEGGRMPTWCAVRRNRVYLMP